MGPFGYCTHAPSKWVSGGGDMDWSNPIASSRLSFNLTAQTSKTISMNVRAFRVVGPNQIPVWFGLLEPPLTRVRSVS